jgi:uncharacterized protein YyaL (SSP411 family)
MAHRANRLASETSPYLRQHAHNPVDWYPWGPEALGRARAEDRPILLSIGYSACHWCHVMERESFENDAIAAVMNEHFVNIKVDREERPDLDTIYMNAVQMLTGAGGWPLTVFLTPEGKPFFGGTYFPPEDRYGRPGFPRVLAGVSHAYRESRDQVDQNVTALMSGLERLSSFTPDPRAPSRDIVTAAAEGLLAHADRDDGGIGGAPKFPNVPAFSLWLRCSGNGERPEMRDVLRRTLTRMARGGIYDHLAGGFHRYSVDAHWLVPHFEKMLYDNAQLARLYLDAFVATGDPLYRQVAVETLDYLLAEMRHPEGGFFSAQDADTDGEEGKTYLWRLEEVQALLEPKVAEVLTRYYQVDEVGNFAEPGHERKSILNVRLERDDLARLFSLDRTAVDELLAIGRRTLLEARRRRPQPALDDKILTSWNALVIRALVRAHHVLGEDRFLAAALSAARFLGERLTRPDGRLLRSWRDGRASYDGYLDDHAFVAAAELDLFEATADGSHLERARALADVLVSKFADRDAGGFFFTASDHESLIDRPKVVFDGSLPSGNAIALETLIRLSHLTGDASHRELIDRSFALFAPQMRAQPFGTASLIGVLDEHLAGPVEVIVVGGPRDPGTRALVAAAHEVWTPRASVLAVDPAEPDDARPLAARGKTAIEGVPTAYVCHSFQCSPPVVAPEQLRSALREAAAAVAPG